MSILRSVCARPGHIVGLLVLEAALMGLGGAILGLVFVRIGLVFAGAGLASRWGIVLSETGLGQLDMLTVGLVTAASALMGLVPAMIAYRHALSDGSNVEL